VEGMEEETVEEAAAAAEAGSGLEGTCTHRAKD